MMAFEALDVKNKQYYVYGLGVSGRAVVRQLISNNIKVIAYDDSARNMEVLLDEVSEITFQAPQDVDWTKVQNLVLSPGIPSKTTRNYTVHHVVNCARHAGVEIVSDIGLFARCVPNSHLIAVTGTNGKSSTSSMIHHFLGCCGVDAQIGGNIGVPVFDLKIKENCYYVVECSSFQLELTQGFNPNVVVWTNIHKDHIDRHGSMGAYVAAKKKIFTLAGHAQKVVMCIDDHYSRSLFEKLIKSGNRAVVGCSLNPRAPAKYIIENEGVIDTQSGHYYLAENYMDHRGKYYASNLALAVGVISELGLKLPIPLTRKYQSLPHRQQFIGRIHGFDVINDSKSTNLQSTLAALQAYDNIYLILGGISKDHDLSALLTYKDKILGIFLYGQSRGDFANELDRLDIDYSIEKTLEETVTALGDRLVSSVIGTVLFSPACASFDQFKNFEDRGKIFYDLIKPLLTMHIENLSFAYSDVHQISSESQA